MDSKDKIREHILDTYTYLRIGMAGVSIIFPLILWWVGLIFDVKFQASISSYYHTPMRDIFVGSLIAIGAFLWFYQGITKKENIALNCAGILAIVVAFTPTEFLNVDGQVKCETFTTLPIRGISEATASYIHGTSAILFFVAIAFVCIFTRNETLKEISNPVRKKFYKTIYNFLGAGMIVSPLTAAFLLLFWKETSNIIYFVESVAVWAFSAYWIVKTKEINESQVVRKSLH
ncbi:hypothetical protein NDI45_29565 [Leptolyngbya sp. GB1-A1]|uniref:hypothetical protein n=1 Tax=Leptolyngbya sp. GB1-A1 TaxID=2933908 RepID=UPI0032975247